MARYTFEWVFTRVVHGGSGCHGGWVKGLYLIRPKLILFQPQRKIEHVFIGSTRVRGDELGDEVLLLPRFFSVFVEHRFELIVSADAGLHHL